MRSRGPSHQDSRGGERAGRAGRRSLRAALAGIVALAALAVGAPAASAAPWACDGAGYTTQFDNENPELGTLLFRVEQQPDGSLERLQIGNLPEEHLNAIGFRPQDGFMYALNRSTDEIMRIIDDGSGAPEFEPIGFPAGAAVTQSVIATILDDGNYFIWAGEEGTIIDVSGPEATLVENVTLNPASAGGPGGDVAVSPIDGEIYAASPKGDPEEPSPREWGVYRYSLEGGVLTREERVGDATAAGGQWFVPDGRLVQYNNSAPEPGPEGNGLYATNIETGELTFHGSGPAFSNADGTGCPNGLAVTKDADPRTVVAGTQVTYSHTITSRALEDAPVEFADVLPAGMTYVSGSVTIDPPSFGTPNAYADTDTLEIPGTLAPDETVTITATAAVPSSADCGSAVPNQSQATLAVPELPEVTFDSDDVTTPEGLNDPTIVEVACESDLAIEKSAPAVGEPGGSATWTLTVTNEGPSDSSGSTVTDSLPDGVTDPSTSTSGCSIAAGELQCSLGALEAGASTEVEVTGTLPPEFSRCVTNTATVDGLEPDPNPANDSAEATTCIRDRQYTVALEKTASRERLPVGGRFVYRMVATNAGPDPTLPTLAVADTVPSRLGVQKAVPSQGSCAVVANQVTCAIGALAPGASATIRVLVVARQAGGVTNNAVLTGCPQEPCDTAQAKVQIEKPRLVLQKRASRKRVEAGQKVRYAIVVRNPSKAAVRNVRVCDRLPRGLVHLRSTKGAKLRKGSYCWRIKGLAPGKKRTFKMVTRALRGSGRRLVNRATAASPNARAAKARRAVRVSPSRGRGGGVTG